MTVPVPEVPTVPAVPTENKYVPCKTTKLTSAADEEIPSTRK